MENKMLRWQIDDTVITLCPRRGRIFQVEVEGSKAIWTNPSYQDDWNIGGDRMWIAPEVDWYWTTLKKVDFQQYKIPEEVDPGNWEVAKTEDGYCRVRQDISMKNNNRDSSIRFELTRSFTAVQTGQMPYFRKHTAYQTDNELCIRGGTDGQKVGLWSILQVPAGGKMYTRCYGQTPFRCYFGTITDNLWRKENDLLQLDITANQQYKIGIAPDSINGTVAYARKVSDEYLVICRKFFPQPWRTYCDVPILDLKSQGDAIQVYNDDGEYGQFGEMEYHSPSLQVGTGNDRIMDSNLTIVGLVPEKNWQNWLDHWL